MTWPVGVGFTSRGPTGAGRIHDDNRQAFLRQFQRNLLGLPFRALVMICHLRLGGEVRLIRGLKNTLKFFGTSMRFGHMIRKFWQPDAADGARVNDPRAPGLAAASRTDRVPSTFA